MNWADHELMRCPGALVFDCDGVLTDNRVTVDSEGNESLTFDRSDGLGIRLLLEAGIHAACITSKIVPALEHRCVALGLTVVGSNDKRHTLESLCSHWGIERGRVVYIGNDVNDLDVMRSVGLALCPLDAHSSVKQIAYTLHQDGGRGVVRYVIDQILEVRK